MWMEIESAIGEHGAKEQCMCEGSEESIKW